MTKKNLDLESSDMKLTRVDYKKLDNEIGYIRINPDNSLKSTTKEFAKNMLVVLILVCDPKWWQYFGPRYR